MNNHEMYGAVVMLDARFWSNRKADDVLADWIQPLCSHPQIKEVIFAGDVSAFAHLKISPKIKFVPTGKDERALILESGRTADVEGVLRLNHFSKLRFPIMESLLDSVFKGYNAQAKDGYFQMDLADLPYPFLTIEVVGKAAMRFFEDHPDVPLDYNRVVTRHAKEVQVERGILPYETRLAYLENPNVEYYTFPKFMALESSRLCNLRCTMCVTHSDFIDHSHLEKYPKHFDLEKYKYILDQMVPYKDHMSIAPQFQGEPFMAPHINEMISYARGKGFCVGFTSNATLWNDDVVDFMIDHEVNNLCVSLDGATKDTYEAVRIGAKFETVVGNLNKLVQRKLERGSQLPWLAVNMTLMPENRHQQKQLLDEWLGKAYLVSLNNTCINHVVPEKFHQPERYPCPFLWEGVHILTNGDVIACCRDSDYEEVMGNSYDTPILDIWNGEKYRKFRMLHATKRWNEIPICARCDTWMCKTRKTVSEGERMVFQYPFYRQYVAPSNERTKDWSTSSLEEIWSTLKNTTKKMTSTLINLSPLRSKAS